MINSYAAITDGQGNFEIKQIEVNQPAEDEVLVEIKAAGICHTDWDSLSWGKQMILGHEGAGIVLETGKNVNHVKSGDAVLLNWAIPCYTCFQCINGNYAICEDQKHAHPEASMFNNSPIERSFKIGTMSNHTVVNQAAVIKMDTEIAFSSAAIVGCGVMTGYGSVINAAKVKPGSSLVVIGCGGVGLNVIQAAKIAGAGKIIAIDLKDSRLKMASQFGATHLLQPNKEDKLLKETHRKVLELTDNRGADYAFECTGVPALGAAPLLMVRNAGTAVQVSGIEEDLLIDMNLFEWDKVYINPLYGKCNPKIDFPKLFAHYAKGDLLLDELVTQTYSLEELQMAFNDMLSGKNAKGVIVF